MSLIETILYDIYYLLDNGVFDELYLLLQEQEINEINYNEYDKNLFLFYISFIGSRGNNIFCKKDFIENELINEFKLHQTDDVVNIYIHNKSIYIRNKKYYKSILLEIKNKLIPLYNHIQKYS